MREQRAEARPSFGQVLQALEMLPSNRSHTQQRYCSSVFSLTALWFASFGCGASVGEAVMVAAALCISLCSSFIAPPEVRVTVRLLHTAAAADWLRETALAVSDPASPRYGEVVPKAAVAAVLAPPSRVDAVNAWLSSHGAADAKWTTDSVNVHVSVAVADQLRRGSSSVAKALVTVHEQKVTEDLQRRRTKTTQATAQARITPQVIHQYLGIASPDSYAVAPTSVGIASPFDEDLDPQVAAEYVAKYGVGDPSNLKYQEGSKCVGASNPEPNLDVQMVLGTASCVSK